MRAASPSAGHSVANDHSAAVMAHDRDVVDVECVDDETDGFDVSIEADLVTVGIEAARTGTGQIDDVTRHMLSKKRQHLSPGSSAHRPAVHEQHVGARPDPAVRDVTGSDIDEPLRFPVKQVACVPSGETGHDALGLWIAEAVPASK